MPVGRIRVNGVLDMDDRCQFSVLPETVPIDHLLPNHYADIDGDGYFESVNSRNKLITDNSIPFSKTFGCSCKEILATKPGDTFGEFKFGCTKGTMDVWTAGRGWGKK